MKCAGIYCWYLNGVPNYIGKSVDVKSRMYRSHSDNEALNRAVLKYGYDAFEKRVVCHCNSDELDDLERRYIQEYKTHRSYGGYNLTWGGDGVGSGEDHPLFGITGEDHPSYGQKRSEETIRRLSQSHKGILHSEESRKKISAALRGKNNPFFGSKKENATSKYFGVAKKRHKFMAFITVEKRTIYLGYYDEEIDAARIYDEFVKRYNLPNPLNNV